MDVSPHRIGILGGTFNPIHQGHILMAQKVREALALDGVLLIPAADPPHKEVDGHVSAQQRYNMARLAAAGAEGLAVSDIELLRGGISYTADTVLELAARYPGARLYVIVGSDLICDLAGWHDAGTLFRLAAFVGVKRAGQNCGDEAAAALLRSEHGADVTLLDIAVPPVSSTLVRERVYAALPAEGLIPGPVEAYIYENGLYFPEDIRAMQAALRETLSGERFRHTMGVVRTAVTLAARFGADSKKARLAALLHDSARGEDKGSLSHAATGAYLARTVYHVADEEVLRAIRLHTTLAKGAGKLDKIIYIADMIEPGRDFPGVEKLRLLAETDLDAAVYAGLRDTVEYVRQAGKTVHPDSLDALKELTPQE